MDALERVGGSPADSAFDVARIEAGMPLFKVDFDDSNLPQEVGRDKEAISFTKGCYLGQETVARIDGLGHVNQRIVGVQFTGHEVPAVGTELILAGAAVGRVTSSAFSPALGAPLALAMVRREANAVGTRLESAVGACEVIALGNTNQH
jgi:folate-binding protein YgfZ